MQRKYVGDARRQTGKDAPDDARPSRNANNKRHNAANRDGDALDASLFAQRHIQNLVENPDLPPAQIHKFNSPRPILPVDSSPAP